MAAAVRSLTAALALLWIASIAHAEPAEERATGSPLRVGYAGSAPFVVSGDHAEGLSIGVWRAVADRAGLDYRLTEQPSVSAALDAVARGDLDVAVGPISITSERARRVRFTQPYFQSEIGILAREQSLGLWDRIAPFLTKVFAGASFALVLSLLGVGTAVWLLERRKNPDHFPRDPLRGIGNGIWFALVTMTTVGYGDRAPITPAGRVLTGIWMLIALVTTTSLTAGVASAFTVLQLETATIKDAGDLEGESVAVLKNTTAARFAKDQGAELVGVDDLDSAIVAVRKGRAAALVHDQPILRYWLLQNPGSTLRLADAAYEPQGYGFALGPSQDVLQGLNVALLAAKEDGQIRRIADTWLGSARGD